MNKTSSLFVRPSVCMEQLGSYWTDFCEILYLSILRKFLDMIQVLLKSDKNKGHFTRRPIYIFDHISLSSSQNEKYSDKSWREIQTTHLMINNIFFLFRKSCCL
jgi:hypothetical protein